jgi:hypothetical protein
MDGTTVDGARQRKKGLNEANGPECATPYYLLRPGGALGAEKEARVDFTDANGGLARWEKVREDIARRTKRACSHLGDDEFRRLVDDMTDRQIRGELRANQNWILK